MVEDKIIPKLSVMDYIEQITKASKKLPLVSLKENDVHERYKSNTMLKLVSVWVARKQNKKNNLPSIDYN